MQAISTSETKKLNQYRRFVYNATYCAVLVLLFWWLMHTPLQGRGPYLDWLSKNPGAVIVLFWPVAQVAANLMCRVAGLSLAGKTCRTVQRTVGAELHSLDEEVVIRPDYVRYLLPIALPIVIFIGASHINSLPLYAEPKHFDWVGLALLVINLAVLCTAPFAWLNRNKPVLQVDENGIAYCGSWGVRSGFISWQEIESCERLLQRNTLGTLIKQSFVFKAANQRTLKTLSWPYNLIARQNGQFERCWVLIQKRLTGECEASPVVPLELAPPEIPVVSPKVILPPTRIIERDNQLPDELRRVGKPLVFPAGTNRYVTALTFSIMLVAFLLMLVDINPLSPAAQLPSTFKHTFFEDWPIWLIMLDAVVSFVGVISFMVLAPLWWRSTTKPDLIIDDESISYRDNSALKAKVLKWEQIAVCEVRYSNFFGGPVTTAIVLKDASGQQLLKMNINFNLAAISAKDAQRVANVIEKYLTGRVHGAG